MQVWVLVLSYLPCSGMSDIFVNDNGSTFRFRDFVVLMGVLIFAWTWSELVEDESSRPITSCMSSCCRLPLSWEPKIILGRIVTRIGPESLHNAVSSVSSSSFSLGSVNMNLPLRAALDLAWSYEIYFVAGESWLTTWISSPSCCNAAREFTRTICSESSMSVTFLITSSSDSYPAIDSKSELSFSDPPKMGGSVGTSPYFLFMNRSKWSRAEYHPFRGSTFFIMPKSLNFFNNVLTVFLFRLSSLASFISSAISSRLKSGWLFLRRYRDLNSACLSFWSQSSAFNSMSSALNSLGESSKFISFPYWRLRPRSLPISRNDWSKKLAEWGNFLFEPVTASA